MKELIRLFLVFAKIGVITFGGGYAMLPNIRREVVDKYNWATDEELLNYFALGQCTPGVIAVNTATFVGYKNKKTLGAIFATAGIVFPSLIIITVIAAFITNFTDIVWVGYALSGIRITACALILKAVIDMWKKGVKDLAGIIIFAVVLLMSLFFDISPVIVVVLSIATGIAICRARGYKE